MKKLFMVLPLVILLCFTFSCQNGEEVVEGITEEGLIEAFGEKALAMWNEGNLDVVEEIIAPEYIIYSDPGDPYEKQTLNHDTYKQRILETRTATPDIQFTSEDVIIKGDKLVNRWTMSGTNKQTGKQYSVTGLTIYHVVDGKLKGHWQNIDRLGLYQQLGFTLTPPKRPEPPEEKK
jgi:ketosteroid isomerase-like protein